jgi:hypothetical protein
MKPEGQGDAMWNNLQRSVENAEAEPIRLPDVQSSAGPADDVAPADQPRHEDVKHRVRELIGKYPTVRSQQLYDLAVRMHPELEQGGLRSFHARYVLPIKREIARAEGRTQQPRARKPEHPQRRTRRPREVPSPDTDGNAASATRGQDIGETRRRVRAVLMRFSRELVNAESRADLVDVLARVEDVVDEVIGATNAAASES